MDSDLNELRYAEFNDRYDWMRELYFDATVPFDNGNELNFRIGRQQVVWGRTDLFRVLDMVNPIDFSIQNIYEEFEDSRIPMGIFSAEYRMGAVGSIDDLNFQYIWKFENFRPDNLGQGGQPYSILDAGNLFRALATCWLRMHRETSPRIRPRSALPPHRLGAPQPAMALPPARWQRHFQPIPSVSPVLICRKVPFNPPRWASVSKACTRASDFPSTTFRSTSSSPRCMAGQKDPRQSILSCAIQRSIRFAEVWRQRPAKPI
jgi:hypothetical protein